MKRHESIVALSREHHFGLLFCWKVRQGLKMHVPSERIQPYVKYFWDNHLQGHFKVEETLLFPLLRDNLVEQAISEHEHIRQLVKTVITVEPVKPDQLLTLADILDDHVRFEERTLFPYLEKELPENKLSELGMRLQVSHQTREKDDYPDEFWVQDRKL